MWLKKWNSSRRPHHDDIPSTHVKQPHENLCAWYGPTASTEDLRNKACGYKGGTPGGVHTMMISLARMSRMRWCRNPQTALPKLHYEELARKNNQILHYQKLTFNKKMEKPDCTEIDQIWSLHGHATHAYLYVYMGIPLYGQKGGTLFGDHTMMISQARMSKNIRKSYVHDMVQLLPQRT